MAGRRRCKASHASLRGLPVINVGRASRASGSYHPAHAAFGEPTPNAGSDVALGDDAISVDGEPVLTSSGYARVRLQNDARGNWTVMTVLDEEGKLVRAPGLGFAVVRRVLDARGEPVTTGVEGADGELVAVFGPKELAHAPVHLPTSIDAALFATHSGLVVAMRVNDFTEDSKGRSAGVMRDDLVVGYDGKPVRVQPLAGQWHEELLGAVTAADPDSLHELEIVRKEGSEARRLVLQVPGGLLGVHLSPDAVVFKEPDAAAPGR